MHPDKAARSVRSKSWIAALVVSTHILCLRSFGSFDHSGAQRQRWQASVPEESFAVARIIVQSSSNADKVPAPLVKLEPVLVSPVSAALVQLDDPDDEQPPDIVGLASFPQLARMQSVDVRDVARRAGIAVDRPLTVVLSVQVNAEGAATAINVLRSCGVAAGDQAAIDYALLVRWVPGTVNREPRSMRVILPVTLDAAGNS